ncbi:hypothetical protein [Novosphingobium sp. PC22D]|nr:hypothetical protein [Novosphingobium sp. PC22D]
MYSYGKLVGTRRVYNDAVLASIDARIDRMRKAQHDSMSPETRRL